MDGSRNGGCCQQLQRDEAQHLAKKGVAHLVGRQQQQQQQQEQKKG
jgi:hypothetical protein